MNGSTVQARRRMGQRWKTCKEGAVRPADNRRYATADQRCANAGTQNSHHQEPHRWGVFFGAVIGQRLTGMRGADAQGRRLFFSVGAEVSGGVCRNWRMRDPCVHAIDMETGQSRTAVVGVQKRSQSQQGHERQHQLQAEPSKEGGVLCHTAILGGCVTKA